MSKKDVLRILSQDYQQAARLLAYPKVKKEEVQAYHDAVEVHSTFVEQQTQEPQAKLDKLKAQKEKLQAKIDTAASELADAIQEASAALTKRTPIITVAPEYFVDTLRRSRKIIDYIALDGVTYEQARGNLLSDKRAINRDKEQELREQYNKIERAIYLEGTKAELKALITEFEGFIKGLND